jgi:prepilin peptidase dependent protein B
LKVIHSSRRSRSQRGLSIIELMVGVAIGMFIVGGAIKLFVDMFGNNRRLLIETRVNQDLRAAADVIARDLRRAGYWRNALSGVATTPTTNPYSAAAVTTVAASGVTYAYDKDGVDIVDNTTEQFGFRVTGNVIEMRLGGSWQQLTDPHTVEITNLNLVQNAASSVQWATIADSCPCIGAGTCVAPTSAASAVAGNWPQLGVRWVDVVIEGRSATDARVTRRVVESVRLRNEQTRGVCP